MAVSGKTARRSLPYLETTDAPKIHEAQQLLANALDNDVIGGQGTLAERPGSPFIRGRLWYVKGDSTAINNGIMWWDNGTGWVAVNGTTVAGKLIANPETQRHEGNPVCGNTNLGQYEETAIQFTNACVAAWCEWIVYTDSAKKAPGVANFNAAAQPNGKSVMVYFQSNFGALLYPIVIVHAIGY